MRIPIADVVARYGLELRRSGRALVGRCPFHADNGRPNLYVYPETASFYCYRCGVGGDAIRFVELIEHVDFMEAVRRLGGATASRTDVGPRPVPTPRHLARMPTRLLGPDERSVLAAAVELYSQCLLADAKALAYIESRALTRDTVERYRLGYCAGDALVEYLRWRRLPIGAARRVGLLTSDQREFFAGRVIVPEFRRGQPIWLIGRAFPDPLDDSVEKYLGLPGPKPLLGWEESKGADAVWVVEAPFDRLTLREWGVAAIALAGTRVRPEVLAALARFPRLVLCLNDDAAGQAGTAAIETAVGSRAIRCPPLPGVKDPNELGQHPDGQRLFTRLAQQIEQTLTAAA